MANTYRIRRLATVLVAVGVLTWMLVFNQQDTNNIKTANTVKPVEVSVLLATEALQKIEVKGRAPKTDYSRAQFGDGWATTKGCDTRNIILNRDLSEVEADDNCNVTSGTLNDPYTGKIIEFVRGSSTSTSVQIDHVVALSDAWQKGAQQLSRVQRIALANDPLELLAVDGPANQQKSDGDAATWLPSYKPFRCQYIARQIAIKQKYNLWITEAEKKVMVSILSLCPIEMLPVE